MKHEYNSAGNKDLRRKLRKEQTIFEALLWSNLRGKRFHGLKFFRQYGVGRYILDFYCPKLRFAIELDGRQHLEKQQEEYDRIRDEYLDSMNIKVLRIWNNEVANNMDGVLERLYYELFGP